jgi:predicted PurR-regulated permease PerM
MEAKKIDISHKTVFFIAAFLGLVWALIQIREVIVLLFIAIILMSGLYPIVRYLERFKVPKTLSIGISYLLVIAIFGSLISLMIVPFIEQTRNLVTVLPQTVDNLLPPGTVDRSLIQRELTNISSNALTFSLAIFNNFIALISILVLTFYLLIERENLDKFIAQFFVGNESRVHTITEKIQEKLGAWLRGQVALSLIIGFLAYISLTLLNVPYALPLAILAGLFEVVPVIGPIISAIPAILVAFLVSPLTALAVAGVFFLIQQLENSVIVPQVMNKAVGLNPLVVILAVAIGGKLLGISGALLAVPITVVIQVITENILHEEQSEQV